MLSINKEKIILITKQVSFVLLISTSIGSVKVYYDNLATSADLQKREALVSAMQGDAQEVLASGKALIEEQKKQLENMQEKTIQLEEALAECQLKLGKKSTSK